MSSLTLEVPQEVVDAMKLPAPEVKSELLKELALILYQRGALPMAQAHKLAQMTRIDFIELLGERDIPRQYSEEDLKADIAYGLGHQ